jgi:hypothetical protein
VPLSLSVQHVETQGMQERGSVGAWAQESGPMAVVERTTCDK